VPVSGVRERIRTAIPFSTDIYEWQQHVRRRAAAKRSLYELINAKRPLRLELGAGGKPGTNGWLTIDTEHGCDLYWDLREPLPFPDGSVQQIYSSHLWEHLPYRDGQRLLQECVRLLAPGGSFSICVPNGRLYIEAYINGETLPSDYFGWEPAYNNTSAIDAVNYVAYMDGEHRYLFDQENLEQRLRIAGLVQVRARHFDPELDSRERDFESIYAIGFKASNKG